MLTGSKRAVVAVVVLVYIWLFVLDDDNQELGPEEIDKLRRDLAEWVEDNEEELRATQKNRREMIQKTCKRYTGEFFK